MKRVIAATAILVLICMGVKTTEAQEDIVDRLSVAFSDPDKPGFLEVGLVNGGITVTGYEGTEVVVEARTRMRKLSTKRLNENAEGMIQIPVTNTGLEVEEENNRMDIDVESWRRTIDLTIQVPHNTSLDLHCTNNGDISVENVNGELEVNNINGKVTLTNVSGSVVAHALNKDLVVTMREVYPDKPMSFSSLNGDIDVTFPSTLRANVHIKADNGDVFTDFDLELSAQPRRVVEENRRDKDGRYRVKIDRSILGTINGGGPDIHFKSFQADIFIRKAK